VAEPEHRLDDPEHRRGGLLAQGEGWRGTPQRDHRCNLLGDAGVHAARAEIAAFGKQLVKFAPFVGEVDPLANPNHAAAINGKSNAGDEIRFVRGEK